MQTKRFSKHLAVLMGCASLLTLAAQSALAQSALAQSEGVETVMVTVEHRSENQQDVPVSTSTLSGDNLDTIFQAGADIRAIAAHTPSLYAESSNGRAAPRFYIRGLGNSDFDLAASQPVSIIMDDVVMENVVLKSAPLYDLANVEIDRGPQGTLLKSPISTRSSVRPATYCAMAAPCWLCNSGSEPISGSGCSVPATVASALPIADTSGQARCVSATVIVRPAKSIRPQTIEGGLPPILPAKLFSNGCFESSMISQGGRLCMQSAR